MVTYLFCFSGLQIDTVDQEDEYFELPDDNDEEGLIRYYFFRGFEYEEILMFLEKHHDVKMSIRTLKRRIKSYGLRRRQPDYDLDSVHAAIQDLIDGPGSMQGYRSIWHMLQLRGIRVPRVVVQELL